jgi:hypothetical protein
VTQVVTDLLQGQAVCDEACGTSVAERVRTTVRDLNVECSKSFADGAINGSVRQGALRRIQTNEDLLV